MTQEKLLSISAIAQELSMGKGTLKFLLKNFKNQLSPQTIDGQLRYPANTISLLFKIQQRLEMGELPSDIKEEIDSGDFNHSDPFRQVVEPLSQNGDIRLSNDGLKLLKSLFHDIGEQQERIANAHEKRAVAEERKAVAIEKRAIAEEKKAQAMNNIATALQEMNRLRTVEDPAAQQIVHQAAEAVGIDEKTDFDDELDITVEDPLKDIEQDLLDDELPELTDDDLPELDDEEDLIADETETIELDDLNSLIDTGATDLEAAVTDDVGPEDQDTVIQENPNDMEALDLDLDDLSKLIEDQEEPDNDSQAQENVADSSEETGDVEIESEIDLDDLSLLIDEAPKEDSSPSSEAPLDAQENSIELDDLSKLIEPQDEGPNEQAAATASVDTDTVPVELDDLSALIGDADDNASEVNAPELDDLSKLIDQEPAEETPEDTTKPAYTIDISPEDNMEAYKAEVMKLIIGFKKEGLTAEQSTKRLNDNQIKTLSGKSEWGEKAISQIYNFIESAN